MQEVILDVNLMLVVIVEQEVMLVTMLKVIVKLEVIQDVNNKRIFNNEYPFIMFNC